MRIAEGIPLPQCLFDTRELDNQGRGKKGASLLYATIRRFEGVTDPREVARRVNEGLVPLISQIPGFLAYSWVDAGGGVLLSINLFENQAGAEEANRQAPDWVRQHIATLLPNPPRITAGEVVAHLAR